jgi:hypothetical protein
MKESNLKTAKTLQDLKKDILADGVIDAQEVKELEAVLYADGIIDKEEAEFLFELNDSVSGKQNHSSWSELFSKAIGSFLLDDEQSPGEIDKEETEWLFQKIQGDGQIDSVEKNLLLYLKNKSNSFPDKLESLIS